MGNHSAKPARMSAEQRQAHKALMKATKHNPEAFEAMLSAIANHEWKQGKHAHVPEVRTVDMLVDILGSVRLYDLQQPRLGVDYFIREELRTAIRSVFEEAASMYGMQISYPELDIVIHQKEVGSE